MTTRGRATAPRTYVAIPLGVSDDGLADFDPTSTPGARCDPSRVMTTWSSHQSRLVAIPLGVMTTGLGSAHGRRCCDPLGVMTTE